MPLNRAQVSDRSPRAARRNHQHFVKRSALLGCNLVSRIAVAYVQVGLFETGFGRLCFSVARNCSPASAFSATASIVALLATDQAAPA